MSQRKRTKAAKMSLSIFTLKIMLGSMTRMFLMGFSNNG